MSNGEINSFAVFPPSSGDRQPRSTEPVPLLFVGAPSRFDEASRFNGNEPMHPALDQIGTLVCDVFDPAESEQCDDLIAAMGLRNFPGAIRLSQGEQQVLHGYPIGRVDQRSFIVGAGRGDNDSTVHALLCDDGRVRTLTVDKEGVACDSLPQTFSRPITPVTGRFEKDKTGLVHFVEYDLPTRLRQLAGDIQF